MDTEICLACSDALPSMHIDLEAAFIERKSNHIGIKDLQNNTKLSMKNFKVFTTYRLGRDLIISMEISWDITYATAYPIFLTNQEHLLLNHCTMTEGSGVKNHHGNELGHYLCNCIPNIIDQL